MENTTTTSRAQELLARAEAAQRRMVEAANASKAAARTGRTWEAAFQAKCRNEAQIEAEQMFQAALKEFGGTIPMHSTVAA